MAAHNPRTEEGNHSEEAPLGTSFGAARTKAAREIANNPLGSVSLLTMTTPWTRQQLHERQTPTRRKRSIVKQDNASNVANKATSPASARQRKIGSRTHSTVCKATEQST